MPDLSPPQCPGTVTVRRNPPRRARLTPQSNAAVPTPTSSSSMDVPNFPTQDILSMEVVHPVPKPPSNPNSAIEETLKVFLRVRPLSIAAHSSKAVAARQPKKKQSKSCLAVNDSHSVTISQPPCDSTSTRSKSEVYAGFSHVFSSHSSQDEVYEKLMRPIVDEFLSGRSGLLAALGPSGSGKTHTVFGSPKDPGLLPRALRHIFDSNLSRSFYLSIFEICSEKGKTEKLYDLSPDGGDICMQQSVVKGLKEVLVTDVSQAESLLAHAKSKRATAMTNSNHQSSRSQCIINIRCAVNEVDGNGECLLNDAVLTFVDLAGAEREKKTRNQGGRLLESNFINNTSMVFGLCLRSLLEHQKNPKKPMQKHFQSSQLTRYLRDYLEGRKRMALILTVRSGEEDYFDASFLLRQASPFMEIKFHNVEETSNLPGNKRCFQSINNEQRKRVKLRGADSCKDVIGEKIKDSNNLCKEDQIPGVNANSSPDANCAKTEREYHVMQGFAKALWNVLKQYKERVQVMQNEINGLTENLRIGHDRYILVEKELKDLKSRCSCLREVPLEANSLKGSANSDSKAVAQEELTLSGSSQEVNGLTDLVCREEGVLAPAAEQCLNFPECDVVPKEVHGFADVECKEEGILDISAEQCSTSERKENDESTDAAACLAQPHVVDSMVQGESSGLNTLGKKDKENAAFNPGSTFSNELEAKQTSSRKPLNAEKPKRRLMPASSLLLRDVSGMEITNEPEKLRGGRRGQKLSEDESKRSRGNASLLRLLKNHLPR